MSAGLAHLEQIYQRERDSQQTAYSGIREIGVEKWNPLLPEKSMSWFRRLLQPTHKRQRLTVARSASVHTCIAGYAHHQA